MESLEDAAHFPAADIAGDTQIDDDAGHLNTGSFFLEKNLSIFRGFFYTYFFMKSDLKKKSFTVYITHIDILT